MRARLRAGLLIQALLLLALMSMALWSVARWRASQRVASDAFATLRIVSEIGARAETARGFSTISGSESLVKMELERARARAVALDPEMKFQLLHRTLDRADVDSIPSIIAQLTDLSVQSRQSLEASEKQAAQARFLSLSLIAITGTVLLVANLGVARWLLRSVDRSIDAIEAMLSSRPNDIAPDVEFARASSAARTLLESHEQRIIRLRQQLDDREQKLQAASRLATAGSIAAGVAHEISNPLAIVSAYAQRARRNTDPIEQAQLADSLDVIVDESFRAKRIIQQLLQLTRSSSLTRCTIDLVELVKNYVEIFARLPEAERVCFRLAMEPTRDASIHADADELRQVLANLLTNALRATAQTAQPSITVCIEPRQQMLLLSVIDNGTGMDEPTLARAFEPFFTKSKGDNSPGVGLGLAISRSIVESLGGVIEIHSKGPDRGATVVVALPAASMENAKA